MLASDIERKIHRQEVKTKMNARQLLQFGQTRLAPVPTRLALVQTRLALVILVVALLGLGPAGFLFADSSSAASGLQALQNMQDAFRAIAQKVTPTVVEVDVVSVVKAPTSGFPFDFFFGNPGNRSPRQQEFRQSGLGSGVIVQRDRDRVYVLTNNHVVGNAEQITVKLNDGRQFTGKLVGADDKKDLALVVFETRETVPVAVLGDSDTLQVGDWVLAVGSPLGFASTVTQGIVSAIGRQSLQGSELGAFTDYIQTDAAINQGNSGGALVNIRGEVIGINSWIASPSGGNVGLGFAIPINNARKDIGDLLTKGKVEYGWLGINVGNLPAQLATEMNLGGRDGAFVSSVFRGSPAEKAGIEPGDFVTSINGSAIKDAGQLLQVVGALGPGSNARFEVVRLGKAMTLTARIAAREDEQTIANQANRVWPGMMVTGLTADLRSQLNLSAGDGQVVVAYVQEGSAAAVAGIRQGDVIRQIDGTAVKDVLDFYRLLNGGSQREASFRILRQGTEIVIGLPR
jgi:Do/DeqQ family serine protease